MDVVPSLSSQSCVVEWNGLEIGAVQNLVIQGNYNIQRVTNLWGLQDQAFVRGTPQYNASATKAFIDLSTFFGGLKAVTDLKNAYVNTKQAVQNGTRGILLSDVAKMIGATGNALTQLFTGAKPADEFFSNIYFDIKIKAPAFNGLSLGEASENEVWVLEKCKIVARQVVLDPTQIIILEKVDIFAKSLQDMFLRSNRAGG